jgi:hypothetical protein
MQKKKYPEPKASDFSNTCESMLQTQKIIAMSIIQCFATILPETLEYAKTYPAISSDLIWPRCSIWDKDMGIEGSLM